MTTRLALAGWAVLLALLLLLAPSADNEGSADADRLVALDIGEAGAAVFRVRPETSLRVVLHLEVPEEAAVDPKARWTFGATLTVLSPSGLPTSWTHHVQSRVSFDEDLVPLVTSARPGRRVTAGRVIDLDPGFAPFGGRLEVTPASLPAGTRLLVRAFDETGGPAPAGELRRAWPRPFPVLTDRETDWFRARVRMSLAPDQLLGETVPLLRRHPADGEGTADVSRQLQPGEATAVNVVGPANLTIGALRPGGRAVSGALAVDIVGETFGGSVPEGAVVVPEGEVWSVRVHNDGPKPVIPDIRTFDEPGRWGAPPQRDGRLLAEERRMLLVRLSPNDATPVRTPVDSGAPVGVLRVDARASRPGTSPVVTWSARGDDGGELSSGTIEVPWAEAPFERFADPTRGRPGELVTRFVLHPGPARTVEWRTDAEVDLRFLVPAGIDARHPPEYDLPEHLSARFAPWVIAPWITVEPLDRAGLIATDRMTTLVATVRIEPSGRVNASATGPVATGALHPSGAPPRHPVLEPVVHVGPFRPWHRTRVSRFSRLLVPDDGVLRVDHRVPAPGVGKPITLTCDGERHRDTVASSRGRAAFRGLEPGWRACTLEGPSGLWFARAPGSGERWAKRTLYRADRGPLRFEVPNLTEPGVVFIRPYGVLGAQAPTVLAEVDGGVRTSSARVVARPSEFARLFVPDETRGRALLDNGGTLDQWRGMRLVLGEDLVGSRHVIEVQATSEDGTPVYVRVDASWDAFRGRETRNWPELSP